MVSLKSSASRFITSHHIKRTSPSTFDSFIIALYGHAHAAQYIWKSLAGRTISGTDGGQADTIRAQLICRMDCVADDDAARRCALWPRACNLYDSHMYGPAHYHTGVNVCAARLFPLLKWSTCARLWTIASEAEVHYFPITYKHTHRQ